MKKINIKNISSIKVLLNQINTYYIYKREKKFLFLTTQREGFYYKLSLGNKPCETKDFDRTKITIKNNIVYFKPHIEFVMNNGKSHYIFFETEQETKEYLDKNEFKELNLIEIV